MSGAVVEVTDATFATEVSNTSGLVMVDFWAAWCGPCKMVAPIVEQLASDAKFAGKIKFAKLDVDANPEAVKALGIMSMPTFVFFKDGQPAMAIRGAMSKRDFTTLIDRVVKFQADRGLIQAAYDADKGLGAA